MIPQAWDRACHLAYPGGVEAHGWAEADAFWLGLRAAFPSAGFAVHHVIGREDAGLPPRAAVRWSLTGRHDGWGAFGRPSGAAVHVMGICHAEFGPYRAGGHAPGAWSIRREWALLRRDGDMEADPGPRGLRGMEAPRGGRKEETMNVQTTITRADMEERIVRYGELRPCKTAFIDAHTPGSNQKENFTIIGGGVSESPDQHVHIREPHGFNIGAAGQPPRCRNSLHSHRTAEVFFVLKGRWRFFWGRWGNAGEVTLEEGDIINIPTGIFRGFENIGLDYGMIMAVLGGDDAGGGVIWAPQVIEDAAEHGLVLGENGKLYDGKKGQSLPEGVRPMPVLTEKELASFPEPTTAEVLPNHVARYWDLVALADRKPVQVIGENGLLRDRPGFEVGLLTRGSASEDMHSHDKPSVLMPVRGHWRLSWDGGESVLAPGDTASVPAGLPHGAVPSMEGEAALYHVVATDDPAGPTWKE